MRAGWPATLVANRIDSTLRGNIGATTQALVEELRDLVAGPVVALCVPAHPDAQRQTVAGVQLLAGRRLEETELAADPRSPIARSDVAGLLAAQTDLPIVSLPLETVTGPVEGLVEALAEAVRSGAGIVVADALTLDHVDRVAAAAVRVEAVTWLSVDPGPATVALARALGLGSGSEGSPYLAVSGSATDLTRRQLARLQAVRPVHVVRLALDADGLPDADATTAALVARDRRCRCRRGRAAGLRPRRRRPARDRGALARRPPRSPAAPVAPSSRCASTASTSPAATSPPPASPSSRPTASTSPTRSSRSPSPAASSAGRGPGCRSSPRAAWSATTTPRSPASPSSSRPPRPAAATSSPRATRVR